MAVTGGNDDLLRMFREFEANEGFLKSCFLSNRRIAISHAHLTRTVAIGALATWVG